MPSVITFYATFLKPFESTAGVYTYYNSEEREEPPIFGETIYQRDRSRIVFARPPQLSCRLVALETPLSPY